MLIRLTTVEEVPEKEIRQYYLDETEILVIKFQGKFYSLSGRCTHAGAPLVEGSLEGDVLTCPWHGSQFKVTDGSVVRGPSNESLKTYKLTVENNIIFIEI